MRAVTPALILFTVLIGCGRSTLRNFSEPDKLIVFSIDGRDVWPSGNGGRGHGVPKAVGDFHGYPILGSVDVADADERKRIIASLKDGIDRGGTQYNCFWPRHGLRVTKNGKTVEYVICFQCGQYDEIEGSNAPRHDSIATDIQPSFDQLLSRAGVPIAPAH